MPQKKTVQKARKAAREGKAPTTQAGEFVREEMHHAKEGKHSSGNPKQAIAIGLSQARRAGVDLPPPKKGKASETTRKKAERDRKAGQSRAKRTTASSAGGRAAKRGTASARKASSSRAPSTTRKSTAKRGGAQATRKSTATSRRGGTKTGARSRSTTRKKTA